MCVLAFDGDLKPFLGGDSLDPLGAPQSYTLNPKLEALGFKGLSQGL